MIRGFNVAERDSTRLEAQNSRSLTIPGWGTA